MRYARMSTRRTMAAACFLAVALTVCLVPTDAILLAQEAKAPPLRGVPAQHQLMDIPKLTRPPKLDGRLEDGEWDGAAALATLIEAFHPGESFDYPEQKVYFAYDDKNLYMAMRSHFPLGAKVVRAASRGSLADPDVEVWASESFELYLKTPGDKYFYRFAGSVGGGFTEFYKKDYAWNGQWTYRTFVGKTILSSDYWDVELAVPFATLGIDKADHTKLLINLGRTWRCLDKLGITSWSGSGAYSDEKNAVRARLSPTAPAMSVKIGGSPRLGRLEKTFTVRNNSDKAYRGTLEVRLQAHRPEDDTIVARRPVELAPGGKTQVAVPVTIADPKFRRIEYSLNDGTGKQPQSRHSVPFALRTDFLDIVPLCLQNKLVLKPAARLMKASVQAKARGEIAVHATVFDPAGKRFARQEVTGDDDIWIDLPKDGPEGSYRVALIARDADGRELTRNDKAFYRPRTPVWMTRRDDSMDRVLPPFTPMTLGRKDGKTTIGCWGRKYGYAGGLYPASISSGKIDDLLAAPMEVVVDGEALPAGTIKVRKSSKVRQEIVTSAGNEKLSATADCWIEYDGVLYNTLELKAVADVGRVELRIPIKAAHAQYAHVCGSGMGGSGGFTKPAGELRSLGFWPMVWLGDYERGLCWFAEADCDLACKTEKPISVKTAGDTVTLTVVLAEEIPAGKTASVKFGLLATPVKPLHPRYPLNVFAGARGPFSRPPKRTIYSGVSWTEGQWFLDVPYLDTRINKVRHGDKELAAYLKRIAPSKWIPYFDPYTLSSEYAEANHYLREWEILPTKHSYGRIRPTRAGPQKYTTFWMSPQAESFRKYFVWRIAELIQRTGIEGLYFDFSVAYLDSNRYHGARSNYPILGIRDLYRRLANEFVKAGVEDYVIIGHNSRAVQIPTLTFLTHFFNGEHHRYMSGSTLHGGKDYLDTLPLYYYGIEHSGLPWGIHGNMLVEFPQSNSQLHYLGIKDEPITEYLWNRQPSVMMPILLHNSLPGGYHTDVYYYKAVYGVLEDFDVPTAVFHPYWRNGDKIEVDNPQFKVSFYTRPDEPRSLLVVGNLGKKPGEVTLKLNMRRMHDLSKAREKKADEILRAVERIGARDAKILELGPKHIKLWVKGHSMALVEVAGHRRFP